MGSTSFLFPAIKKINTIIKKCSNTLPYSGKRSGLIWFTVAARLQNIVKKMFLLCTVPVGVFVPPAWDHDKCSS